MSAKTSLWASGMGLRVVSIAAVIMECDVGGGGGLGFRLFGSSSPPPVESRTVLVAGTVRGLHFEYDQDSLRGLMELCVIGKREIYIKNTLTHLHLYNHLLSIIYTQPS